MADSDRDEDEMEDDDNNDSKKGRNGDRLPCGENREMIASIPLSMHMQRSQFDD